MSDSPALILTNTPNIGERAVTDISQIDQSINPSLTQSTTGDSHEQSPQQSTHQSTHQSPQLSPHQSTHQPTHQSTQQSMHPGYSSTHPRRSSVSVAINPPLVQADDQSIDQPINQSINQPKPSPKLTSSTSSYCLSPSRRLSVNTHQPPHQSSHQTSHHAIDTSINEPLSAPPEPGPPPAPLLESMAAISSRRANAGMIGNVTGIRPSQSINSPDDHTPRHSINTVYNSGSGGFLTELLGRTQNTKQHLDKLIDEGRKRAAAERAARLHRRANNLSIDPPQLPTYQCPRCQQSIYEFDRESHATSHSSEILPFLYLGGERNASNKTELTLRTNITHILNVAWEVANFYPDTFVYENYALSDYSDSALIDILDSACCFIERCRLAGGSCLVHCVQGISRSASVVTAYLIVSRNLSAKESIEFVREKRSLVDPNPGFRQQLERYEQIWKQRRQQGYTLEQLLIDHQRPILNVKNDRGMNQALLRAGDAVKDSQAPRLVGHSSLVQQDILMSPPHKKVHVDVEGDKEMSG